MKENKLKKLPLTTKIEGTRNRTRTPQWVACNPNVSQCQGPANGTRPQTRCREGLSKYRRDVGTEPTSRKNENRTRPLTRQYQYRTRPLTPCPRGTPGAASVRCWSRRGSDRRWRRCEGATRAATSVGRAAAVAPSRTRCADS